MKCVPATHFAFDHEYSREITSKENEVGPHIVPTVDLLLPRGKKPELRKDEIAWLDDHVRRQGSSRAIVALQWNKVPLN